VTSQTIRINRAPVLTLWAAVVAERLGYDVDEALTLGRAVAGLNAQLKARHLGIYESSRAKKTSSRATKPPRPRATLEVELLGRVVPVVKTPHGVRSAESGKPADPAAVQRYLEGKFGEALPAVRKAFTALARAYEPETLAERGFALYEEFRPEIPAGQRGWGAKGVLDLARVATLARSGRGH
jgi:hypothetical protein